MKKLFAILATAIHLIACNNSTESPNSTTSDSLTKGSIADSALNSAVDSTSQARTIDRDSAGKIMSEPPDNLVEKVKKEQKH